jgi:hypothetical protein
MVVIKSFIEEDQHVSGIETDYGTYLITTIKSFMVQAPGQPVACTIKIF